MGISRLVAKLDPRERSELADTIDSILAFLGVPVVPILKAEPSPLEIQLFGEWAADIAAKGASIGHVETQLAQALMAAWADKVYAADLQLAAWTLEGKVDAPPTQEQIEGLLAALAEHLGPQLANMTQEEVTRCVGAAYLLGRYHVSRPLGLSPTFALIDEKARGFLISDTIYWVGKHYDSTLGGAIAGIARQFGLEQGLGRVEVGQKIKEALQGSFRRSDAYWTLVAAAALNRARAFGGVQSLVEAEVEEYEILAMMDERCCDLCQLMNGQKFRVEHAVALRDAVLGASTPDEVKELHPWHSYDEVKDWGHEQFVAGGMALPPFHGNCRCTYVVSTFREVIGEQPLAIEFAPVEPQVGFPNEKQLTYVGSGQHLGGAGVKDIYQDMLGQQYIFKPAQSKAGTPEAFRAYVQEAAAALASRIYEPGQFVEIHSMTLRGKFGSVQPLLAGVQGDLKALDWRKLGPDAWNQVLREHVLDWTIGNFDSHGGNFIRLADGRILGIDKEQAFRYLLDKASWSMSTSYHPNAAYGEQEPLYNTIFRAFAQGEVDLDLQTVLPALQRLEKVSDLEYKSMLRPYAEALHGKGAKAEQFLDLACQRKNGVREEYRTFFTQLLKKRDPDFKGTFKFLDEMKGQELKAAPQAARLLAAQDYSKMTAASLKQLAKQQAVPYWYYMSKDELVTVLADPAQADQVAAVVRDRQQQRERRARAGGAEVKAAPTSADVFSDLSLAKKTRGMAVRRDADMLEGQQFYVRAIRDRGRQGYEIAGKITEKYHAVVEQYLWEQRNLEGRAAVGDDRYYFYPGRWTSDGFSFSRNRARGFTRALTYTTPDGDEVVFVPGGSSYAALRGQFTIRVYGTGPEAAERLQKLLRERLDLPQLLDIPTIEDDRALRLARLAWQHAPDEEFRSRRPGRTARDLEAILRARNIDPARADNLVREEVWPGYVALVEPGAAARYEQKGAAYLFAGVPQAESVVKILGPESPGLMSTMERFGHGLVGADGASSVADLESGGADSAFARLVPQSARGRRRFRESFLGDSYRLIIDVKQLERTDWYAYPSDSYGGTTTTWGFHRRPSAEQFVERMQTNYEPGNEVMFRRGIPKKAITRIAVDYESQRLRLLELFRQAGIEEINGQPIERFVRVQQML